VVARSGSKAVRIQTRDRHVAAGDSDGYSAAVYAFGGSTFFALLIVGAGVALAPNPVSALPSFARQTGQPCSTCHSAFPQLTPYGRRFKLNGYTAGGTRCGQNAPGDAEFQVPISGMTVPSFTHLNKAIDPADTPKGFKTNDNTFVQEISVFYGGQIYCNFGAFVQGTYERPGSSYFLDNADIRYANKIKVGETDVVYGVTANNNPTVQDPWNTTPAWSFPFVGASDALAPTPSAGTMIEGTFEGRVAGTGAYIFANDKFYLEGTAYGTFDTKTLEALGLDPTDPASRFDGLAPYWRAAYESDWGNYSVMFGTFGMFANVAPIGNQSAPTDKITDVGGDAQFQYIGEVHALTARISYIFEHEKLDGSQPLGLSSNSSDNLNSFKVSGSYVYDGVVSFTAGYFNIWGDDDQLLFADSLSPSALGSPNSNGWIFDLAWIPWSNGGPSIYPWFNARLGVSFTLYNQFNGASSNYDGAFRNASDNNTTFLYAWLAF
jgi:hypothetical protein